MSKTNETTKLLKAYSYCLISKLNLNRNLNLNLIRLTESYYQKKLILNRF